MVLPRSAEQELAELLAPPPLDGISNHHLVCTGTDGALETANRRPGESMWWTHDPNDGRRPFPFSTVFLAQNAHIQIVCHELNLPFMMMQQDTVSVSSLLLLGCWRGPGVLDDGEWIRAWVARSSGYLGLWGAGFWLAGDPVLEGLQKVKRSGGTLPEELLLPLDTLLPSDEWSDGDEAYQAAASWMHDLLELLKDAPELKRLDLYLSDIRENRISVNDLQDLRSGPAWRETVVPSSPRSPLLRAAGTVAGLVPGGRLAPHARHRPRLSECQRRPLGLRPPLAPAARAARRRHGQPPPAPPPSERSREPGAALLGGGADAGDREHPVPGSALPVAHRGVQRPRGSPTHVYLYGVWAPRHPAPPPLPCNGRVRSRSNTGQPSGRTCRRTFRSPMRTTRRRRPGSASSVTTGPGTRPPCTRRWKRPTGGWWTATSGGHSCTNGGTSRRARTGTGSCAASLPARSPHGKRTEPFFFSFVAPLTPRSIRRCQERERERERIGPTAQRAPFGYVLWMEWNLEPGGEEQFA